MVTYKSALFGFKKQVEAWLCLASVSDLVKRD